MAEVKISELTIADSILGTEVLAGVESVTTKGIKAESILMTQSVNAIRWKSFRISPTSSRAGGSKDPTFLKFKDDGSGSQGVFLWHFSDTTEEEIYFDMMAPTDWKEGTTIYAQIDWVPLSNGGAGETVCWGIEDSVANRGDIYGNTFIIYSCTSVPDEDLVAYKHYYTELEITTAGGLIGNADATRVFRDATSVGGTDDYGDNVALISITVRYESDGLGASSRTVK